MLGSPDENAHTNPVLAYTDSNAVRGGKRTVTDRYALYALADYIDQLKQDVTVVTIYIDSENGLKMTEVILRDINNVGAKEGWENYTLGAGVTQPYTIYKGSETAQYATLAEANAAATYGEIIFFNSPGTVAPLPLADAINYATRNIPIIAELITDNGQRAVSTITGGIPKAKDGENAFYRRKISLTNAASKVTLEAALYAYLDTGSIVTLTNGAQLIHRGLLGGWGGSTIAAELSGSSRYIFTGITDIGGSSMLTGSGTSYAEFNLERSAEFNFRSLVLLAGSAECVLRGGAKLIGNVIYPFQHIGVVDENAVLRLKSGVYENNRVSAFTMSGGSIYVSSKVLVKAPINTDHTFAGTSGTVYLHAGAVVEGTIDSRLTVVELPEDSDTAGSDFIPIPANTDVPYPAFNTNQHEVNLYLLARSGNNPTDPDTGSINILDVQGSDDIIIHDVTGS